MIKGGNLSRKDYISILANSFAKLDGLVLNETHLEKATNYANENYEKYKKTFKTGVKTQKKK